MRQFNTECIHFARGAKNDYCMRYFPAAMLCVDCDTCSWYELRPAYLRASYHETLKQSPEHAK